MEGIQKEYERLRGKSNLDKSIKDIDKCINQLLAARDAIQKEPSASASTMAKLEVSLKSGVDKINEDLKEVYSGLNKYGKALDKKFKASNFPLNEYDVLQSQDDLINRAIAMHLIREGQFNVADTFIEEARLDTVPSNIREKFASLYTILDAMEKKKDLMPAIRWAASERQSLEARGSNLEFELHSLMFVHLFSDGPNGPAKALAYGRREFAPFQKKYLSEITRLTGALAFIGNLNQSPYADLFNSSSSWSAVAQSFTGEFCALLKLSAESPLHIAATAGAIALPTLLKMSSIMKEKKTEWTSQNELPVEIPLPPKFQFHSIFVCPVSKEQSTEENPPMMLPCGHVIADESLRRLARGGSRFKCPYCPNESMPNKAIRVYL